MASVLGFLAISLVLTGFILLADRFRDRLTRVTALPIALAVGLFTLVFRILPFIAVYIVVGLQPRSDVMMPGTGFWAEASSAAQGLLIYRDFPSNYDPLFPYILGAFVFVWHNPRAIILAMIVIEALAVLATTLLFKSRMSASLMNYNSLIYFALPAPFTAVIFGGQEDVWMWLPTALAAWLLIKKMPLQAGLLAGLGFLSTKILLVVALLNPIFTTRRPQLYIAGLALITVIPLAILWFLAGPPMLFPLTQSATTSPPNIWFTLNGLSGGMIELGSPILSVLSTALVGALGLAFSWFHRRRLQYSVDGFAISWIFIFCLFMCISVKSLANYLGIFMIPLIFLVILYKDRQAWWATLLLNLLGAVQIHLWFANNAPDYANFSYLHSAPQFVGFVMELVMLLIFVLLLRKTWLWARRLPQNQATVTQQESALISEASSV